MNLLLTCSTTPDFSRDALELWNKFCIADWMPGEEIVRYLLLAPVSEFASIDAIIFLEPSTAVGFDQWPDGRLTPIPALSPWHGHYGNSALSDSIRNLPETCAMRDGRKWKRIPQIVLTKHGHRHLAYDGLDVEFVIDVTELMLFSGYASPVTWNHIERVVNKYHQKIAADYEEVGFLVTVDHGVYRIKRAFHKKNANESQFYHKPKDKRRFRGFVTFGRDRDGIDYEAQLFEHLLNDPKAGERELHIFFEQHPNLLGETMMGTPISHQPYFTNKQTPDFLISPILPRDDGGWVKLLEIKGPHARTLGNKRALHRGFAHGVQRALDQVRDYDDSIHDPSNLATVEKALGYVPQLSERAVLVGRTPRAEDMRLWDKRKAEQPSVKVITYDELLQDQRDRFSRRRGAWSGCF